MNNELKHLLRSECNLNLSDEIIEKFIGASEEIHIKPRKRIIDYGRINSNIYCIIQGIIRIFYVIDGKEVTFGFATPGTIILSPYSYFMNIPAFLIAENCKTTATVLKMRKENFDRMLTEYSEFSQWMFRIAIGQLFTCEKKLALINGTARERYAAVLKNRPEIIKAVPSNIIASYLGITPQYLCSLKHELLGK